MLEGFRDGTSAGTAALEVDRRHGRDDPSGRGSSTQGQGQNSRNDSSDNSDDGRRRRFRVRLPELFNHQGPRRRGVIKEEEEYDVWDLEYYQDLIAISAPSGSGSITSRPNNTTVDNRRQRPTRNGTRASGSIQRSGPTRSHRAINETRYDVWDLEYYQDLFQASAVPPSTLRGEPLEDDNSSDGATVATTASCDSW